MTRSLTSITMLLLATTVGCDRKPPSACEAPIRAIIERIETAKMGSAADQLPADLRKRFNDEARETTMAIADAMIGACVRDQWPPRVIECIKGAKVTSDLDACTDQLSPAQQKAATEAVTAAAAATPMGARRKALSIDPSSP